MPDIFPDDKSKQKIANFLLTAVPVLFQNRLPNSGTHLRDLAQKIRQQKTDLPQLSEIAKRCIQVMTDEWDNEPYRSKLKSTIYDNFKPKQATIPPTSQQILSSYESMLQVMAVRKNTVSVMNDLAVMISSSKNQYEKFLLSCFFYVVALEGDFDQSLTIVYMFMKRQQDQPISLPNPRSMNISKLKQAMKEIAGDDTVNTFFEGYNSNLRNSIAHANFCYDHQTCLATFQDFLPSTGERT
ncbi:MAG: hypothetical protein ACRDF4_02685 [Rhabdochlamydiaceae bacterium]